MADEETEKRLAASSVVVEGLKQDVTSLQGRMEKLLGRIGQVS